MKKLLFLVHVVIKNLRFRNLTLSLGRRRQRMLPKCVPHGQHYSFSSFNQSDHCFLELSLSLPPLLLKLLDADRDGNEDNTNLPIREL